MKNSFGYHMMVKPMGAVCNLACTYCFYLEKKELFPKSENYKMPSDVLENYIKKYIQSQSSPLVSFVWQGGEPLMIGLEFYKTALELQKKYSNGKIITNSIQTNGILINEEWCQFFKENDISIGISLDGDKALHDRYRVCVNDRPSFDRVFHGFKLLQKYEIEYNILVCVCKDTQEYALDTYHFLKQNGVKYIQFTPIVERTPDTEATKLKLTHAMPQSNSKNVTDFSVDPVKYGDYLITIFNEWVKNDVGDIFIMNFEWALTSWLGLANTMCIFTERCGGCSIIEHNGDIYSCDHYMYPDYKLGNIISDDPLNLMTSQKQYNFGEEKANLPENCRNCSVLFACRGECPRHRFEIFEDGEYHKSYLCEGYKKYFRYIHPYMKAMKQLIENNIPVSRIMTLEKNPVLIVQNPNKE